MSEILEAIELAIDIVDLANQLSAPQGPPGNQICDVGGIRVKASGQHENDIWIRFPNGATLTDPIHDGQWYKCGQDINSNGTNLVAVRYGEHRDVHNLYGLTNGGKVIRTNIRIHDGRHHGVSMEGNEYHIVYGRNHDLQRHIVFDGERFMVTRHR